MIFYSVKEMIMLNVRGTFWCIFGILFVFSITSAALAQQEQQPDTALSQSQFMQIIDRIDKVEENMRDHVDKKFGELDKKIDDLEAKFHELDKKLALVDLKANILIGVFGVIITLVVIPILVPVLKQVVLNRLNRRNNNEVSSGPQPEAEKVLREGNFEDRA